MIRATDETQSAGSQKTYENRGGDAWRTAMLSAIETGRKAIPDRFVADVVRAMELTSSEHKELRAAKERTIKEVSVEHLSPESRELVSAFARNQTDIPDDLLQQIRKIVLKSCDDETPFKRKKRGILVSPKSRAEIEDLASRVRAAFGCTETNMFPIIEVVEFALTRLDENYVFDVWDCGEMGDDEGRVIISQNALILRRDVYDDACRNGGRGRFTAAHELGHYLMHREISLARACSDSDPIYRDAEWQADSFAGNLMMPRNLAARFASVSDASAAFGTSEHATKVMFAKYGKK